MKHTRVHRHVHKLEVVAFRRYLVHFADDFVCHGCHGLQEAHVALLPEEKVTIDRVLVVRLRHPILVYVAKVVANVDGKLVLARVELRPFQGEAKTVLAVGLVSDVIIHLLTRLKLNLIQLETLLTGRLECCIDFIENGIENGIPLTQLRTLNQAYVCIVVERALPEL